VPLGANGTLIPITGVIGDKRQLSVVTVYFRSRLRPFIGESQIVIGTLVLRTGSHEWAIAMIAYDTVHCPCVKCTTPSNNSGRPAGAGLLVA
jgi:hypothetical protein